MPNIGIKYSKQIRINIDGVVICIEVIGKHGNNRFFLWTEICPSEGIHPRVDSMPLVESECWLKLELIEEQYGISISEHPHWVDILSFFKPEIK